MIIANAAKCRYCGEIFDRALRRKAARESNRNPAADLTVADWLIGIFCALLGCIIGLIRVSRGDPSGGKLLALSVISTAVWNAIAAIINFAAHGQ